MQSECVCVQSKGVCVQSEGVCVPKIGYSRRMFLFSMLGGNLA